MARAELSLRGTNAKEWMWVKIPLNLFCIRNEQKIVPRPPLLGGEVLPMAGQTPKNMIGAPKLARYTL